MFAMDSEYDLAMERRLHMEGSQEISVVNEFLEVSYGNQKLLLLGMRM